MKKRHRHTLRPGGSFGTTNSHHASRYKQNTTPRIENITHTCTTIGGTSNWPGRGLMEGREGHTPSSDTVGEGNDSKRANGKYTFNRAETATNQTLARRGKQCLVLSLPFVCRMEVMYRRKRGSEGEKLTSIAAYNIREPHFR